MKTWILAVFATALGLLVGGGVAWSELSRLRTAMPSMGRAPNNDEIAAPTGPVERDFPKVAVEGGTLEQSEGKVTYVHNFGAMELQEKGKHVFVFRNLGKAPLMLSKGEFTCSCTVAELPGGGIPPGGTAEVVLAWEPKGYTDHFSHGGDILTNDPEQRSVHLAVRGRITQGIRYLPSDLVFEGVSASEPHSAAITIYDYLRDDLALEKYEFDKPETAEFFEVASEPLSAERLASENGAKGGVSITVTIKPGLPLGAISQTIRLKLNRENVSEISIPIRGRTVGDITFIGAGYESSTGVWSLGSIRSQEGTEKTLRVMIKGPHRHEVQMKVGKVWPEGILLPTLGEPQSVNNGAVMMVPLELKIPPGAPPADHLGIQPGTIGRIQFETTHPATKSVVLYVSFVVEKSL